MKLNKSLLIIALASLFTLNLSAQKEPAKATTSKAEQTKPAAKPATTPAKANTTSTTTEKLKWYSWDEGYKKSKEEGKILLVDVYTDWCGWCKRMDKDTYSKEEVIKLIEADYIPVKFNPEKQGVLYQVDDKKVNGRQLLHALSSGKSIGYPTTVFIMHNTKKKEVVPGYKNAASFKALLNTYKTMNTSE